MFSSGLPVLYPIGCLSFTAMYFVYKALLIYFYQRTVQFNENLALKSIDYIKWGILFHMAIGAVMITNTDILQPSQSSIS